MKNGGEGGEVGGETRMAASDVAAPHREAVARQSLRTEIAAARELEAGTVVVERGAGNRIGRPQASHETIRAIVSVGRRVEATLILMDDAEVVPQRGDRRRRGAGARERRSENALGLVVAPPRKVTGRPSLRRPDQRVSSRSSSSTLSATMATS